MADKMSKDHCEVQCSKSTTDFTVMEHDCYAILYEDKDDHYDESEMHICGDGSLDGYISEAKRMKAEGHRNVRVIEYVIVEREVAKV